MSKEKTTSERGKFKEEIHSALYQSSDIKELLIGNVSGMSASEIQCEFKEHVKSHLFVDDTIKETATFIYYDVAFPKCGYNLKDCKVVMYLICHRDILDNCYKDGYYGNRVDILSQMVEDVLINNEKVANSFGIGKLLLDSIVPYNATRFYGCVLTFVVPTFR